MARPIALTRATYDRLQLAFASTPGNFEAAGAAAGVHRDTARRAWNGDYVKHLPWALPIRDMLAAPLALVGRIRATSEVDVRAARGECEDRTVAQALALSEARRFFADRARHFQASGDDFDAYMDWLAKAMRARTATSPEQLDLDDLAKAVMVAGAYAAVLDKLSLSLERIAAAERKFLPLDPPKPKGANLTEDQARRIIGRKLAQWQNVLSAPAPSDPLTADVSG